LAPGSLFTLSCEGLPLLRFTGNSAQSPCTSAGRNEVSLDLPNSGPRWNIRQHLASGHHARVRISLDADHMLASIVSAIAGDGRELFPAPLHAQLCADLYLRLQPYARSG
jgi:hypothetical protein